MPKDIKWTLDDSEPRRIYNRNKHVPVPAAAMVKYFEWKRYIVENNMDPKTAASKIGDAHYEQLSGERIGEYTIRLSQEHRVAFRINKDLVTVFQIGGHYPKS